MPPAKPKIKYRTRIKKVYPKNRKKAFSLPIFRTLGVFAGISEATGGKYFKNTFTDQYRQMCQPVRDGLQRVTGVPMNRNLAGGVVNVFIGDAVHKTANKTGYNPNLIHIPKVVKIDLL